MPQLQVLAREEEASQPSIVERIQKERQMLIDARFKAGQLKVWAEQNKINAKQAANEEERLRMQAESDKITRMAKMMDTVMGQKDLDPDTKQKFIAQYAMAFGFADILKNNPSLEKVIAQLGPSPEQQEDIGTGRLKEAQAGLYGAAAEQLQGAGGGGGTVPADSRAAALEGTAGGGRLTSMAAGGLNIDFPQAQADVERAKVMARKQAEREVEMRPLLQQFNALKGIFGKAVAEMGGLGKTGLGAKLKGWSANIGGELGKMPATKAVKQITKGFGLALASMLNRGRPSDRDFDAAAALVFSNRYTAATNMYLVEYIEAALSSGDAGEQNLMFDQLFTADIRRSFKNSVANMDAANKLLKKEMMDAGMTEAQAEEKVYELRTRQLQRR